MILLALLLLAAPPPARRAPAKANAAKTAPSPSKASAPALATTPARPGTPLDKVLDALAQRVDFEAVEIAPDGSRVAWVEKAPGEDGPADEQTLLWVQAVGQTAKRITACPKASCNETEPSWSPSGAQLAFLSDAGKKGQQQLVIAEVGTGKVRTVTGLQGSLHSPRWSADGTQLAFLAIEGEDRSGPLGPTAKDSGVVGEQVHEQRLEVIDAAGGKPVAVSPADLFVYEFDWGPDGTHFAAVAARGSGDDNWWVAELVVIAEGAAWSVHRSKTQVASPRWSPDGRSIAFLEGLMSDEGLTGGDLFVVQPGFPAKNLTPGRKASPSSLAWPSQDRIVFAEWAEGDSALQAVDPVTGKIEQLFRGPEHLGASNYSVGFSLARDGQTSAVLRQTHTQPPEIWLGKTGAWTQLTHRQTVKAAWGEAQKIHYKQGAFDQTAWLLMPAKVDPAKKLPLVVYVHGGPAHASDARFEKLWGALAASGYAVLMPNPRGSFGHGEAFTAANVKDFGGGDLQDILAAINAAVKAAPVDRSRVGLWGWSYGGYMAMWAVTQTPEFRAVVAGAGIANWQSYYGQNRIDQWMLPYFGASVYDDPAVYRKSSPIEFIKQVQTPVLILQGDRDAEVPAPQAYEFWHALKTLGVETQLVIYPDEGHVPRQPAHQRDVLVRSVRWFDDHLFPGPAARP